MNKADGLYGMYEDKAVVFTPAGLLEILTQIKELSEYDLSLFEVGDGNVLLQVGESKYNLPTLDAPEISIDSQAVTILDAVNDSAFDNIDKSEGLEVIEDEPIESGIIKELAKTLLVGGVVRLAKKILTN